MKILLISQTLQIIASVLLVVLVLIQSKGKGLSSTVGASVGFYRSRRGLEQIIFIVTILVSVFLVANSLFIVFLS